MTKDNRGAEAINRELLEALRRIAGCDSHHPQDVVAIARAAITKATQHEQD